MKLKIFLLSALIILYSVRIKAQDYKCRLAGKEISFKINADKITVKFKTEYLSTSKQLLKKKLNANPFLETPAGNPEQGIYRLKKKLDNSRVLEAITLLNADAEIDYAAPFLETTDGTIVGLSNQIIVKLKSNLGFSELQRMAAKHQLSIVEHNLKSERKKLRPEVYLLTIPKLSILNVFDILSEFQSSSAIAYAEPNFIRVLDLSSTPNDALYSTQWALPQMNVPNAWNITTGSSAIKIAIIDCGVDLTHPDLTANLVGGYDATWGTTSPFQQTTFNSFGGNENNDSHGTACAGIAAATGNNTIGVAGVAYGCRIMPVRVGRSVVTTSGPVEFYSDDYILADGMDWAWSSGADVLSNSWAMGSVSSSLIEDVIDDATTSGRSGKGAAVLFSSGNSANAVQYPASYSKTIAVGATNSTDHRCTVTEWGNDANGNPQGSCYGAELDIAAPGNNIATTDLQGIAGQNTSSGVSGNYCPDSGPASFAGTSAACPYAAGVMALIMSINPNLTEAQARYALESTCDKVGGYLYYNAGAYQPNGTWCFDLGYGRINAQAAVVYAQSLIPPASGGPLIVSLSAPSLMCWTPGSSYPHLVLNISGGYPIPYVSGNYYNIALYDTHSGSTYSNSSSAVSLYSYAGPFEGVTTNLYMDFSAVTTFPYTHTYYLDVWGNDYVHHYYPITFTVNKSPSVTVADQQVCKGSGVLLGYPSPTVTGGSSPYSYQWGPLSSDLYFSNTPNPYVNNILTTTNYTLTVVDQNGCSNTDVANITVSQIVGHAGPDKNICMNSTSQTIGATATGGIGTYTYSWSPTTGLSNPNIYNPTVTLATPGTYTYTLTSFDNAGCSSTDDVVVTVVPASDPVANAGPDFNSCSGAANMLSGSVTGGTSPYTYTWTAGSSTISTALTTTIHPTSPTTYVFTVHDANGCVGQDQVSVISIFSNPSISASPVDATLTRCIAGPGTQLSSYAYGGTPPYTYLWSPSTGLSSTTITNPIAAPSTGQVYQVVVTDTHGCVHSSNTLKLAVFTGPPNVDFYADIHCDPKLEVVNTTTVPYSLGTYWTFTHPAGMTISVPYMAGAWWDFGGNMSPPSATTVYYDWDPTYMGGMHYVQPGYHNVTLTVKTYDSDNNECYSVTKTKPIYVVPAASATSSINVCGTYSGISSANNKTANTMLVANACSTTLTNTAQAVYVGGHNGISFKPGFLATEGCDLWAFIDADCIDMYGKYANPNITGNSSEETEQAMADERSSNMKIYPNPNNGSFTIILPDDEPHDIYVYDIMGKIVFSKKATEETKLDIDISNFPKGMFMIKATNGNKVQTKRIITE